ncbi:MAG TPA: hypothetical protein VG406_19650 [Isosphaeraceae bacterium]|jgi:hypothetical protein|nr:hypothetical protein [Isosphaeraceae bacterium]
MSRATPWPRRAAGAALAAVAWLAVGHEAGAQFGPGYITPFSNLGPGYITPYSNLGPGYFGGSPYSSPYVTATPYDGYAPQLQAMAQQQVLAATFAVGMMQAVPQHRIYYNTTSALPSHAHYHRQRQEAPRPPLGRDEVLGRDGAVRWPASTPRGPEFDAKRRAADEAVAAVVREHAASDRATVALSVDAVQKAAAFGNAALDDLRANDPKAVADFEYFLRSLDHNILLLADPPTPAAATP